METRANPLCGVASQRRGHRLGGANRRQRSRPLADQQQPRARHRAAQRPLPQDPRPRFPRDRHDRIISRTAVYGPVRTVVWEGRGREAPPYPDCGSLAKDPAARLRPPHPPSVIGFDAFLRGGGTLNPRPARFAPFNIERDIPGPICAPGNALRRVGRYVIAGGVWKERKFGFSWRAVLGSCLAGRTIVWHRHTKQVLLRCVLPSGTAKLLVRFSCINRFYTFRFHAYQLTKRRPQDRPFLGVHLDLGIPSFRERRDFEVF